VTLRLEGQQALRKLCTGQQNIVIPAKAGMTDKTCAGFP
jgi:hypothetical protein